MLTPVWTTPEVMRWVCGSFQFWGSWAWLYRSACAFAKPGRMVTVWKQSRPPPRQNRDQEFTNFRRLRLQIRDRVKYRVTHSVQPRAGKGFPLTTHLNRESQDQ